MPVDVRIPELGESITEAEIVRWLKQDGDEVAEDEPIAEVETDKATAELPCPAAGILEIVAKEGETVKVGDVVARIQEGKGAGASKATSQWATLDDDRESTDRPDRRKETEEKKPKRKGAPKKKEGKEREERQEQEEQDDAGSEDEQAPLSPAVRRLVQEHDLDPTRIPASGRSGRLTKGDILAYLEDSEEEADEPAEQKPAREEPEEREEDRSAHLSLVRGAERGTARPAAARASEPSGDDVERVRMSRLRRSIAQRLVEAQHTAAILTTFNEIDMSRVMELRARFKKTFAETHGVSLGFMSFFARACVLALRDVPQVNAEIDGEEIVYHKRVHLGVAASTDRGLVVPVVRDADRMSFADIEAEIGRLADLARTGKIGVDDLMGGTFTISNGGVFGSMMSTPILNPPQSGILGMHKIEKRPVVVGDEIVVRPMMYVALSYDHRLIDGRDAVTFLVRVKERIEDPERLLLDI